jgi:hypothetical protein
MFWRRSSAEVWRRVAGHTNNNVSYESVFSIFYVELLPEHRKQWCWSGANLCESIQTKTRFSFRSGPWGSLGDGDLQPTSPLWPLCQADNVMRKENLARDRQCIVWAIDSDYKQTTNKQIHTISHIPLCCYCPCYMFMRIFVLLILLF